MTSERHDHAPLVEAWLKEPIFLPEGDTARVAQLVHQTPQQRGWLRRILTERTQHMFTATKFVTASVILAAAGGFLLLNGVLVPRTNEAMPATSAVASAAPDTTVEPTASVGPEPTLEAPPEGAFVFGAPETDASAGGWTQAGSAPRGRVGPFYDLRAIGDTLVARTDDEVMVSVDGVTWVPVELPADRPVLNDLVASDDGLILGGLDRVDGERVARLWTSTDGRDWVETAAPPDATTVSQIVSAQDPLAVRSNQRLFKLEDDGSWTNLDRIPNSQILRGPSGYIVWQGGGQDRRFGLTMFQQAELGGEIREIGLPGRLGRGNLAEISLQLFAVGDQWVMVPEGYETPIYVSDDGFEWQEVPRPDRMLGDYVEWMGMIGDELQAFGIQYGQNGSPSGIWTIDLESDEPASFEMLDRDGDQHMVAPVAFGDGYVALGSYGGPGNSHTMWQHAAD